MEDIGSVLEGSSELSGVHGQLKVSVGVVDDLVIIDRRVSCIVSPVNEVGEWVVSSKDSAILHVVHVSSGDIVTDSEDAVAGVIDNARFHIVG